VIPEANDTFQTLTDRLSVPFNRGSGYYLLQKPEKISEAKDLVWKKADSTWMTGAHAIRTQLGITGGSINPTDLPVGSELYVQSTSHNRRKVSGAVLIRSHEDSIQLGITVVNHGGAQDAEDEEKDQTRSTKRQKVEK